VGSGFSRTNIRWTVGANCSGYARGGGGSGGTERNVIVDVESIDAVGVAAGSGAVVIDGMRPAA